MQLLIDHLVAPEACPVSLGGDGAFSDKEGRGGLPEHPVQSLEIRTLTFDGEKLNVRGELEESQISIEGEAD